MVGEKRVRAGSGSTGGQVPTTKSPSVAKKGKSGRAVRACRGRTDVEIAESARKALASGSEGDSLSEASTSEEEEEEEAVLSSSASDAGEEDMDTDEKAGGRSLGAEAEAEVEAEEFEMVEVGDDSDEERAAAVAKEAKARRAQESLVAIETELSSLGYEREHDAALRPHVEKDWNVAARGAASPVAAGRTRKLRGMAEFTSRLRSDSVPAPKPVPEPAVEEAGHTASTASGEAAGSAASAGAQMGEGGAEAPRRSSRGHFLPRSKVESEEKAEAAGGAESSSEEEEEEALGMTAYERERLANIRRNNEFLVNLGAPRAPNPRRLARGCRHAAAADPRGAAGIDQLPAPAAKPQPNPRERKPKSRAARSPPPPRRMPSRRSARSAAGGGAAARRAAARREMADAEAERVELEEAGALEGEVAAELEARLARLRDEEAAAALQEEEEAAAAEARRAAEAYVASEDEAEAELEFEIDVGVARYTATYDQAVSASARAADLSGGVRGIAPVRGAEYRDEAFKRVYCMSFHPAGNLLAAAGHGGQAGVFGLSADLSNEDGAASIMSWRPHNSWIGEIQWLSGQEGHRTQLITASNDKTMVLWDCTTSAAAGRTRVPKKLLGAPHHFHTGGIFSMHEAGGDVVSAGKDGSVVHSRFIEGGWGLMQDFENLHGGAVIKCVRFRDAARGEVFASGGNDRSLRVTDARAQKGQGVVRVWEDASDAAVNFVQWSPSDQNMLLSAGFDRAISLWDLRATSNEPLHRLQGHHRVPGAGKVKGMHRAAFLAQGRYVITTGEKTDLISIYDVATGRAVSRGESDEGGTAVAVLEDQASCVLAVSGARSAIQLYSPLPA